MHGLAMAAMAIKQRAIDAELRRQRWEEGARQREERELIRREAVEFRRMLLAESQAWSDCQTTIAYLARIRQELGKAMTEPSGAGLDWMDRAENAVRKADPLFRRVRSLKRQETEAIEGAGCGAAEVPLEFDWAAPFRGECI